MILALSSITPLVAQTQNQSNAEASNTPNDDYNEGDVYDDGIVEKYEQNGPGDQYINIRLMPVFPLNFDGQLFIGGGIALGYHRFLTNHIALGGDIMFGYNTTIGSNLLTYIPFTLAVTYQPYIGRFEFPITLGIGMGITNYLANNYFPGLVLKPEVGAYFRFNENWSFGMDFMFAYMPHWYVKHPEQNDYLNVMAISLGARYHF